MRIDRGATTLSVSTRSRGAYVWPLPTSPGPTPTSIVSRKTQGAAGTFDVDLGLNGSGIECRSGGAAGDYAMVFIFPNTLTSVGSASVTSGTGSITSSSIGADPHEYVVNLTGVANQQQLGVTLTNVLDTAGNISGSVPGAINVLIGDINSSRSVNAVDVAQTKSQVGDPGGVTNFREDVNANGTISSADVSLVKSLVGTGLP